MIAASVGDGNQGVAVGKNIVQIGTLVIPVIPVVAGLVLLVAGAGAFVYFSLGPAQMTGPFSVAVAEFGEVDASGQVHHSPDGERLSEWIYGGLQDELKPCRKSSTCEPGTTAWVGDRSGSKSA